MTYVVRKVAPEEGQKTSRIIIDFMSARLGRHARSLNVSDQLIAGVNLAQYKPDVVRVVIDTENIKGFKVSPLSAPARLIVDVWGERIPEIFRNQLLESLQLPLLPVEVQGKSKPPVPKSTLKGTSQTETLLLDVTINTQTLPEIVRAEKLDDGRLALPLAAWLASRLRLPEGEPLSLPDNQRGYALESIPGLTYNLDRGRLALEITAPAAAFTGSAIDHGYGGESPPNLSPPGFYLNYDASATSRDLRYASSGVFGEGVLFNDWGSAVASMIVRGDRQHDEAVRAETFWRKDLPGPMEALVMGDTIGSGGAWSRPARYAGIRWARDFTLRPGFVTMPMPSLSGSAALPSTVDVLINNQLRQSERVNPGPFELTNVPVISGAGEINLIVKDLLGREIVLSQSYYLSPRLLAMGLSDFSLEGGVLRENYGSKSNDYGAGFAAGTWRYGLTSALTGEGRLELQKDRQAAGVELFGLLGTLGAGQVAAAVANSNGDQSGHYLLGLERSSSSGGASLRWEYFDRDFDQFAFLPGETRLRERFSAGLGLPLLKRISAGLNFTGQTTWEGDRFGMASASLGVTLPRDINLRAHASKRLNGGSDWSGGVGLSIPLGNQRTASANTSRSSDGGTVSSAELNQSLPAGLGIGWRLRASDDPNQQWQAGLDWNTNVGSINAEASEGNDNLALRLGANGSVGWLKGLPFATRSIGQGSFAVVNVGGLSGVPVYRSNQLAASTNNSGLALVPGLLSYQKNQLTIDPAELPFDVEIRGVREMPIPYARSGVFVDFAVRRSRNALVVLRQPDGEPVPVGARVTLSPGERQFVVGRRGEAYLMDLGDSNHLSVQWQGGECQLELPLDPKGPSEPRLGPLTCGRQP